MSTITLPIAAHARLAEKTSSPSFARRFFAALVASRTREAERRIGMYLAALNPEKLTELGLSTDDLQSVRDRLAAR